MKIFNSIKWRLQIWYGLILVLVLAGFGFTAYQLESGRQIQLLDNELQRRFKILADTFHNSQLQHEQTRPPFDRPPPEEMPKLPPPMRENQHDKFELPVQFADLFGTNNLNNFYFIIRNRDGNEIARSSNVPESEVDFQKLFTASHDLTSPQPQPFGSKNFHHNRAIFQRLPPGETILVGCSVAPELHELKITALKLFGFGGIILLFGLAGGGLLVSRSIKPIEQISATAVKISGGDLSQRINVAETESELGKLAAVLNSTFARLESAFAQQKQFASDAAHELRTPVSVILTQTQTALNRERDAASYKQTVEACNRAAQRMRKLISSLLELARLDAGQEKVKQLRFDFAKTISDCVEMAKHLATERDVNISESLEPIEITGDSEKLAQVVTNLLTNAIQYNHDGGEVKLKLESHNGFAVLTVADTGAGIPPEDLPHVFKRFYRGDKSRTGSSNSGLGLAISKAIVEAHGGVIEVSSEEMRGTIFTIRLPV